VSKLSEEVASAQDALRTSFRSSEYIGFESSSWAFGRPPEFPGPRRLRNRFDVLSWKFCDDELRVFPEGEEFAARNATASELSDLEVKMLLDVLLLGTRTQAISIIDYGKWTIFCRVRVRSGSQLLDSLLRDSSAQTLKVNS
jgi:hypothetical protein